MTADFRALCAELLDALENAIGVIYGEDGTKHISTADAVITKADAALAQPEPDGVTLDCDEIDVPVWHRGDDFHVYKEGYTAGWAEGVSAAAARWGRPTIGPVPVAAIATEQEASQ